MCEERYRLVVLGSAKVGKTNIIRRYLYNEFSSKYKETIEDLHSREFRIQMSDIWQEICSRRNDLNELPIVVVGNKCDVENKKIYEETAKAFTSRLSSDVRYIEVSAKDNIRITDVFRTLLEMSGFPRCKAGGGRLDDVAEDEETRSSPSIRRSATVRAKSTTKREPRQALIEGDKKSTSTNGSQSPREQPQLDKQASHPVLAVPLHIGDLKRNLSLRMKSPRRDKEQVERKLSDEPKISRGNSLIRRTKHLSLKMRRHGEKSNNEEVVDESDCKIQ
ncbi:CBN-SSR-2 protein [Caenorhabditis brenneri]|uniref:CBN-SSR-2 protein n=1 Tax=Caenorhabditis brenneri TaxID=135651 RepID=G0M706_CAEBE|nr:CBN-SSR-2 protein [Caenorhabditis brenneri]